MWISSQISCTNISENREFSNLLLSLLILVSKPTSLFFHLVLIHLLLLKLEIVRDLLLENWQSEERLDALIYSAIYLKVSIFIFFLRLLSFHWFLHAFLRSSSYAVDKHRPNSLL